MSKLILLVNELRE